jgi:hypothetical protein
VAARVLVVENGPGPAPPEIEGVERLVLPRNVGYAEGMNAGIGRLRAEGCDRLLLLNNDAHLEPGCLRRLAEALEDPRLAAVGPTVLREASGRVESRGARFREPWGRYRLLDGGKPAVVGEGRRRVESLSGAVWMVRADALDRVGRLEETYFYSFEETDWCARARRAGFALEVVLGARAMHAGATTMGAGSPDRLYYAARNHLSAVERLWPRRGLARAARRALVLAWNVGHAAVQGTVPRAAGIRAVLAGAADFRAGRSGPRGQRA